MNYEKKKNRIYPFIKLKKRKQVNYIKKSENCIQIILNWFYYRKIILNKIKIIKL